VTRTSTAAYEAALALAKDQKFIALVEILAPTPIYRALYPVDVVFQPAGYDAAVTYIAEAGGFGELRQTTRLEAPSVALTLQNVRDASTDDAVPFWSQYLQANDLNDTEVRMRVVENTLLGDGQAQIAEVAWYISGAPQLTRDVVVFQLGARHNSLHDVGPGPSLQSDRCWWALLGRYKLHPCNSESDLPHCHGSLDDCRARFPAGAPLRFGPSLPIVTKNHRRRRGS